MTKSFVVPIGMARFLDAVAKKTFGRTRTEAIAENICIDCGEPAKKFKDESQRKEYSVSGLCSTCQDEYQPKKRRASNGTKQKQ